MKRKDRPETMWFITGDYGLYYGSAQATRRNAIADHEMCIGAAWKDLKAVGDRAIKCKVIPMEKAK